MARVYVRHCSYDDGEARERVGAALAAAFGDAGVDPAGSRVLVKPNLAIAWGPERAATTHPAILGASLDWLRSRGAEAAVGDSPAGAVRGVRRVWRATGAEEICRARGVPLVNFEASGWLERSIEGRSYKISRAVSDFDHIVSLPKFKTHILTLLTGAIKNMFGCVPGLDKSRMHLLHPRPRQMSTVLVDIFAIARPVVTVVDAVEAMDGNGPSSGRVRRLGFIASSSDAVALDATLARLVGIDPGRVPTTSEASRRGLGEVEPGRIELDGDDLGVFPRGTFRVPPNWQFALVPGFVGRLLARWFWVRPEVDPRLCTGCGECARACAACAIALDGGKAAVTSERCVSCLCCIEICPMGAVRPVRSALARLAR